MTHIDKKGDGLANVHHLASLEIDIGDDYGRWTTSRSVFGETETRFLRHLLDIHDQFCGPCRKRCQRTSKLNTQEAPVHPAIEAVKEDPERMRGACKDIKQQSKETSDTGASEQADTVENHREAPTDEVDGHLGDSEIPIKRDLDGDTGPDHHGDMKHETMKANNTIRDQADDAGTANNAMTTSRAACDDAASMDMATDADNAEDPDAMDDAYKLIGTESGNTKSTHFGIPMEDGQLDKQHSGHPARRWYTEDCFIPETPQQQQQLTPQHVENMFRCHYCPRTFVKRHNMDNHEKSHTVDTTIRCEFCSKVFSKRWTFEEHQRTHTGDRPYQCELCDKSFTHRTTYVQHCRVIHEGDKRHACDLCGKAFGSKSNLNRHMESHGEQPPNFFVCEVCVKGYTSRSSLLRHQRRRHMAEMVVSPSTQ